MPTPTRVPVPTPARVPATDHRQLQKAAGEEPLPGYILIEPLGRGGFGEVWKCEAPGGLHKAIKFVPDDPDRPAGAVSGLQQELDAFQRIKAIRHPFLLTLERVELVKGELVMVMELADQQLADRFAQCQAAAMPGIPRDDLLGYLADAAEVLDLFTGKYNLQHLDIKPANLFLICGRVKVGDFGLVGALQAAGTASGLARGLTPKYTAPEVLRGQVDPRSDQYSLALVYQELLTGKFPYPAKSVQQMLMQHAAGTPDLSPLPPADRAVVSRALSKKPEDRFATCLDFVRALAAAGLDQALNDTRPSGPVGFRNTRLIRHGPDRVPVADDTTPAAPTLPLPPLTVTPRAGGPRPPAADVVLLTPAPVEGSPAEELNRVFAGARVVEELENSPRGRLLRATGTGNRLNRVRLLKFVESDPEIARVLDTIRGIDHPGVVQRVSSPHPRLVGFAWPDSHPTLADLFRTRVGQGRPGVPRPELLDVLDRVARTLDEVAEDAGLAHLLVRPDSILVDPEAGTVGVTGFGVGELLRRARPDHRWVLTDPFAAPELRVGQAGPPADQFALALVYLEMTQAWLPTAWRTPKELAAQLAQGRIPDHVWTVLRTALQPEPRDRFPTCSAFVAALTAALYPDGVPAVVLDGFPPVISVDRLTGRSAADPAGLPTGPDLVNVVLRASCPADSPFWVGTDPVRLPGGDVWVCRFPLKRLPGVIELKLGMIRDQWGVELDQPDDTTFVVRKYHSVGVWGKLTGKKAGVELVVRVPPAADGPVQDAGVGMGEVVGYLVGTPDPAFRQAAVTHLPRLMDEVRREVQNVDERRKDVRVPCGLAVSIYPVQSDGGVLAPVPGRCVDVSAGGLCFTAEASLPSRYLYIAFDGAADGYAVLFRLSRMHDIEGGGVIAAGRFRTEG